MLCTYRSDEASTAFTWEIGKSAHLLPSSALKMSRDQQVRDLLRSDPTLSGSSTNTSLSSSLEGNCASLMFVGVHLSTQ